MFIFLKFMSIRGVRASGSEIIMINVSDYSGKVLDLVA